MPVEDDPCADAELDTVDPPTLAAGVLVPLSCTTEVPELPVSCPVELASVDTDPFVPSAGTAVPISCTNVNGADPRLVCQQAK